MTKRTFWDEEFTELNSVDLHPQQKEKMWQNIKSGTKKRNRFEFFKNGLIVSAAMALFLIISASLILPKINNQNHSASAPQKQVVPTQVLHKSDSAQWDAIARLRYDLGVIDKIQSKQNQLTITVKRNNSFGSDADPLGQVMNPDTDTRTYLLKTSENTQTLHLKIKQNVLLLFGQYEQKASTEPFWAAEVLGVTKKDGKLYNSSGEPLNVNISSQINVTDGKLTTIQDSTPKK